VSGNSDGANSTKEPRSQWFVTTLWSVVTAAGGESSATTRSALAELCRAYWYPLYAYVRRQGYGAHDAEDLTQGFFAWLLESDHLRVADPERGKFRSFLLARLKNFLSDERKKARAQKRGGGQPLVSLDAQSAEERYHQEPATQQTPERIFDQRWAMTVLEQAVARLRAEYVAADRTELFEALKHFQSGDAPSASYRDVAVRLGLSESAVKSAIFRLRQRHRELLRAEIAQTVTTPDEADDEIRYLISVLAG
jgi:RNA polymerase sigma factor (sigma-70 family)